MSLGQFWRKTLATVVVLLLALPSVPTLAEPAPPPAPAAAPAPPAPPAEDIGWPRQLEKDGVTLVYYQPELEQWKDYRELSCRMAVSLTKKGGKPVLGVASLKANTLVDQDSRTVFLRDITLTSARFPAADAATASEMQAILRKLVPSGGEAIALDRILAMVERDKIAARAAPLKTDPPPIFYSETPAILLFVDGSPAHAPIEGTTLEYVVNTNWDLFYDAPNHQYFLAAPDGWLTAKDLNGPWTFTKTLPADMARLPAGQNFDDVKRILPPPIRAMAAPRVVFTSVPGELILVKGPPKYTKIPGTQLVYVANTDADLFVDDTSKAFFVLISGRWFRSVSGGHWSYAGGALPADFAKIPPKSPKAHVLASVPGTEQAADAVLLSQIPTSAVIDKAGAEAGVRVSYDGGTAQFKPIEQTRIQYAVNTESQVLRVGDLYYLCFQGVWFVSTSPNGPWKTADSLPQEIYTIPPSSPVYNVTYVTQTSATAETVECSHTAGYFGVFVMGMAVGATIAWGTGWYYPPYYYRPPGYGYPVYRPWPRSYGAAAVYNPRTGGYAVGRAAYGPYGAAGGAAWYNPQTGRYGRSASVQGPYGGRSAASTYNPRTGGYARTSQGNNAYAQWGSSVAKRGDQWVQTGHVSTAGGTRSAYRTSSGQAGVVSRGQNGTVARTNNGVYAGRDGNVYKRDGRGEWSQYQNDGWNKVDRSSPAARDLDSSARARERGQAETTRSRAQAPRSSGGGSGRSGGGARGGGARGGGGGRR